MLSCRPDGGRTLGLTGALRRGLAFGGPGARRAALGSLRVALLTGSTTGASAVATSMLAALGDVGAASRLAFEAVLRATRYAVSAKPAKLAMMPATKVP